MIQLMYRCDFCPRTSYAILPQSELQRLPGDSPGACIREYLPQGWALLRDSGKRVGPTGLYGGLACWQCTQDGQ